MIDLDIGGFFLIAAGSPSCFSMARSFHRGHDRDRVCRRRFHLSAFVVVVCMSGDPTRAALWLHSCGTMLRLYAVTGERTYYLSRDGVSKRPLRFWTCPMPKRGPNERENEIYAGGLGVFAASGMSRVTAGKSPPANYTKTHV